MKTNPETSSKILVKFIEEEMSEASLVSCAERAARFARRRIARRVVVGATASIAMLALVFALAAALTRPVRAGVEFSGLFVTSEKTLLTLTDTDARTNSGWITVGQIFSGYKVEGYDAQTDSVRLSKDGRFYRVRLKTPTIEEALLTLEGEVTLSAGQKIRVERAVLPLDVKTTFPLNDRVVVHITPTRTPDLSRFRPNDLKKMPADALFYSIVFEDTTPGAQSKILSTPSVVALPGQEFSIRVNQDLEFWFRPKK